MVQREIRKKSFLYGTTAVLSAIILVSTIYVFGAAPLIYPPNQSPLTGNMKTFSSMTELTNYVSKNSQNSWAYGGGPLDERFFGTAIPLPQPAYTSSEGTLGVNSPQTDSSNTKSYSTTNIQVSGVDEADTVKTDGQYIYTVTAPQTYGYYTYEAYPQTNSSVFIIDSDPQNPTVVSKIQLGNGTEPAGLYLSDDGSKLVVLASKYETYTFAGGAIPDRAYNSMLQAYHSDVYTYLNVYDVSNKATPTLTRNLTVSGSYFNSRMIGNDVYTVVSQPASVYGNTVTLPTMSTGVQESSIVPSSIYYADMNDSNYCTFTSFYGVDIADSAVAPTNLTVVMGGASTMYVSTSNIYVTYPLWSSNGDYTSIYRIAINGLQLSFEAKGTVPGSIINQYAMDEYNGYLRLATNWQGLTTEAINNQAGTKMNNVYVLDQTLTITGKLEGLAQNENLHSARFMGDKCYLVTFKNTDPLFVIDVSQPENPRVLGELKIPGYSDYLHPYDETHLIGLGKETVASEDEDFAWYQGLKLALFDVSDVNKPSLLSNYTIGDRGTYSSALSDPHAFLFDKTSGLLVIPVNLAIVNDAYKSQGSSTYGDQVWQGAYVFNVSVDGGFTLKGTVTHTDGTLDANRYITRSLYIDNVLYTLSNSEVKLNNLNGLSEIATINLN